MKILVINCGSSSLKYQLFDMDHESVLAKGLVERIGIDGSQIKHMKTGLEMLVQQTPIPNHKVAIQLVLDTLQRGRHGVLTSLDELSAVGHRVVHGGEDFASSVKIDAKVLEAVKRCVPLAPLHNPANIMGIEAVLEVLPNVPQVGVFDTAFHQTMPQHAFMYGVPYGYYEKYKVRRYGFHGTSHYFVSRRAAEMLGQPIEKLKIITCHLGNGSSITAVDGGKSVDTSMGFTPLAGVLMGTRSGDVDPALLPFIAKTEKMGMDEIDMLLNKKSGLLGISGTSSDLRDVEDAALKGDKRAQLAVNMLNYDIKKFVGAYAAAMGGVDVLVFTAGVGENSIPTRAAVCEGLEFLGIKIDPEKNAVRGKEADISAADSRVRVLVIPTNEELMIARDTKRLAF
ncbi:acetate kinase [uncultured Fretibacterium sp.]|uniref:acetate/propionate family kinase n=1 Tax=uncultured Fretibacterium sp. TaxID=1678694 RepID=UPI002602CF3F|nr:acetate kinase [uncultured Fretibacterium sp.]